MNALRTIAKPSHQSVKALVTQRAFHAGQTCFTGKTITATSKDFDELVTKANHPVIVDFYADWCGPCKMLGPILTKVVAENPAVTLVKIDVDENTDIASKYRIAALPTVIAFNGDKVVDQFVGMRGKPQLEEFVKKHSELA
ncbi:thioredoxin 2-like protein [Phycomyces blakesleeanus]